MDQISDYSTEPEVVFAPLTQERYCEFYDIEMDGFSDDLQFYLNSLESGMEILEAGCGSGRLSRALAAHGMRITGIDNSTEMLARAILQNCSNIEYICMDMAGLVLKKRFDAAIVAYNTLNLLENAADVQKSLSRIRQHLKENGLLLLQIFIPPNETYAAGKARTFQFQIFDAPNGGKIIKETLKSSIEHHHMALEERYRIRPLNSRDNNEDLSHFMNLLVLEYRDWIRMVTESGFSVISEYGDFHLSSFVDGHDSMLLLKAQAEQG